MRLYTLKGILVNTPPYPSNEIVTSSSNATIDLNLITLHIPKCYKPNK